MRTTVELTENQRAELLRLAAQRGLKGFSRLVQEAIDAYLDGHGARAALIKNALGLHGTLKSKTSDDFEKRTKAIREDWR